MTEPPRRVGLGIDAGGTSSRWHLVDGHGISIAAGTGAPIGGHIFSAAARDAAFATLDAVLADVRCNGQPAAAVAGITGLDRESVAASAFRDHIADRLGIASTAVRIEMDMVIAYHAAFEPGGGILVYSGTGSIAVHVAADSTTARAGGRGVIIDDGGSGFWIAREAIRAVYRLEDREPGTGFATVLGRELAAAVGGSDWETMRAFVYGGDRGRVASLSPAVARAAVAGDGVAAEILNAAGRELAALASALLARLGPRDIVLAGGASFVADAVAQSFRRSLPSSIRMRHERLDSARAAALMALQP